MKDKDYTPMKAKEISLLLGVPKNEYNDFLNILKELEDEYKIRKNRKNRYFFSKCRNNCKIVLKI